MYERNLHDTQNVYINGERIRGVQSCTAGWTPSDGYVNSVGYGFIGTAVDQSLQADFAVERLMVGPHDPIIALLDTSLIKGEVYYGDGENFAFEEGFINSYSCSCGVGSIPTLNFGITAFGEAGGGLTADPQTPPVDDTIMIATPGSVTLDVAGQATNRVQSFDISISINRAPHNVLGQVQPDDYILELPVQVDCQFVLDIDDYESSKMLDFICVPTEQDLNFTFTDCAADEDIRKFFVKNAKLVDFQHSGSIGEPLQATVTYKSLLNGDSYLEKVLSGVSF